MSDDLSALALLQASSLYGGLDAPLLERLARDSSVVHLRSGELVWRAGAKATHFVSVEAGLVAIRQITPEGESTLVNLFGPGENLCITPALQGMRFPGDAVAITDQVTLLNVLAAPVVAVMEENQDLSRAIGRTLVEHTQILRSKIDIVSAGSVPRRLAALMLDLIERFGVAGDDTAHIPLTLTREQLGQLVNARTETVIRILSKWQKAGWFASSPEGFRIERLEILRRIVQGRPPRSTH